MNRRSFCKLLAAPLVIPVAVLPQNSPKPQRRVRYLVRSEPLGIDYSGSFAGRPHDEIRIIYDDEPVREGFRVIKDSWA